MTMDALLVIQNETMFDAWSWVHILFPFLIGLVLLRYVRVWVGVALVVGFEIIENTLLKGNLYLMDGSPESWANIAGDILLGLVFLWAGWLVMNHLSSR